MYLQIKYLTERLEKTKGKPTDPHDDINLAVLNVICAMVFGSRYEFEDPEFYKLIELNSTVGRLFASGQKLQILPLLKYLPTKLMSEVKEVVTFRDRLVKKQIKEHRETFDRENIRDLTDAFIKATKDAEEESSEVKKLLTEDHMILSIMDVFSAGLDTTATTLQWTTAYLATYPQVQRRLQEEIDDVIGRNRLPSLKDKSNLPFLRATITETLRLASTVPILAPHKTTVATTLQGYDIPKDTDVIFNVWAMQHDPEAWENPSLFDPSRFIDSDGKFFYPKDRSFLPFGAGARVCLGESLAKTELLLFLSQLVHQFTFSCPDDLPPPDLNPMFGVVSHPKPYKVNINKRE